MNLQKMFDALEEEMKELKPKMTQNEKNIARNRLTTIMNQLM